MSGSKLFVTAVMTAIVVQCGSHLASSGAEPGGVRETVIGAVATKQAMGNADAKVGSLVGKPGRTYSPYYDTEP